MRSLIIRGTALLTIAFDAAAVCAILGAGWLVGLYEQWRLAAALVCLGAHACVAGYAAIQAGRRPVQALVGLGISFAWLDLSVLLAFKLVFPSGLHDLSETWRNAVAGWFTLVACLIALIAIAALAAAWFTAGNRSDHKRRERPVSRRPADAGLVVIDFLFPSGRLTTPARWVSTA